MQSVQIYGWDGIKYTAADVSFVVVPDLGGRMISLSFAGQEIFYVQREHSGEVFNFSSVKDLRYEKQQLGFRVWGGDKTWIAPEKDWWEKIPPVELDAGRYQSQVEDNCVRMISPVCRETGLQISRTITLNPSGVIILDQEITNRGNEAVDKGIWNVTQLIRPCDVYVSTSKDRIRSYHREDPTLPDPSVVLNQVGALTEIPCRDNQLFKFGGMIDQGFMLCLFPVSGGQLAFFKSFSIDKNAAYLHRSMIEVFNARDHEYLEVEVHAPAVNLKPGQSFLHRQQWRLGCFPRSLSPVDIYEDLKQMK